MPSARASALSGYAFAAVALDRADALRGDAEALRAAWPDACLVVLDADGRAAADADGGLLALTGAALGGGPGTAILLGLDAAGRAWFALDAAALPGIEAAQWIDLRSAAAVWPADQASAFAYARGMLYWQARNRFCGVCGGEVQFRRAGFVGHCAQCGTDHYPRVDPAIIVAVSDGQRLLLGRQPGWPPRRWSLIAGFVEPGETLEQTVVREVFEETRVRVRSCRYLGAQPWPFPGALMLGFCADAQADAPQVDGELEAARWFSHAQIGAALQRDEHAPGEDILLAPQISIARALIADWHARQVSITSPSPTAC